MHFSKEKTKAELKYLTEVSKCEARDCLSPKHTCNVFQIRLVPLCLCLVILISFVQQGVGGISISHCMLLIPASLTQLCKVNIKTVEPERLPIQFHAHTETRTHTPVL